MNVFNYDLWQRIRFSSAARSTACAACNAGTYMSEESALTIALQNWRKDNRAGTCAPNIFPRCHQIFVITHMGAFLLKCMQFVQFCDIKVFWADSICNCHWPRNSINRLSTFPIFPGRFDNITPSLKVPLLQKNMLLHQISASLRLFGHQVRISCIFIGFRGCCFDQIASRCGNTRFPQWVGFIIRLPLTRTAFGLFCFLLEGLG